MSAKRALRLSRVINNEKATVSVCCRKCFFWEVPIRVARVGTMAQALTVCEKVYGQL